MMGRRRQVWGGLNLPWVVGIGLWIGCFLGVGVVRQAQAEPAMTPELCRPCSDHSVCGSGGHCWGGSSGAGVCLQPCDSGTCPSGFSCAWLAPGVETCLPDKGHCPMVCDAKTPCPTNYTCRSGECARSQGGQFGDACSATQACASGFSCLEGAGGDKRCAQQCGPPSGEAGSACLPGSTCNNGLTCVAYGTRNVCVSVCSDGSCPANSGTCSTINSTTKGCVCREDSDCATGQICNKGVFGFQGACTADPYQGKPKPCGTGLACQVQVGQGYLCLPEKGFQLHGSLCTAFAACQDGLVCKQQTPQVPPLCYKECKDDSSCKGLGKCNFIGRVGQYCFCSQDSDCENGFSCYKIPDAPFDHGVCRPSKTSTCASNDVCPHGYTCQNKACVAQVSNPEPAKEPAAEAVSEPGVEVQAEPPVSSEPSGSESSTGDEPTTQEKPVASDDAGTPTEPSSENTTTSDSPQTPAACGCQSEGPLPMVWGLFLFVVLIRLRIGRRKKQA
ncbi:MAG: hypothetical protein EP343_04005 [Deltaproteobacteria bacterium]|nr:MAG: hypothetical protein EP343_04005 [Deltaproteobacteria bacterium]